MKKLRLTIFGIVAMLMSGATVPGFCQSEGDVNKEVIVALEKLSGNMDGHAEKIARAFEGMMQGNDEEMAKWAKEHSAKWEKWAEHFEKEMGAWAEQQEGIWEGWSEKYGHKMEAWSKLGDKGDISPEEMSEMIERNIEMLGDMPLGPMIEGLMKKGAFELKGAPWESLQGLEGMIKKSVEQAVQQAEKEAAHASKAAAGEWAKGKLGEHNLEAILPIMEKLQETLKNRSIELDGDVSGKLKMLKEHLGNVEAIDGAAIKGMVEKMLKERMKMAHNGDGAEAMDAANKAKAFAGRAYEKAMEKYAEHQRAREANGQKPGPDVSALIEKIMKQRKGIETNRFEKVAEELRSAAKTGAETESSKKSIEKIYRALGKERKTIESKEDELSKLRAEILKLRKSIREMKKDDN